MSTYGELTNELLGEFNEQTIAEVDWMSAVGIQRHAKNAINRVLSQINAEHHYWEFNAIEQEQTLIIGTQEYAWPLKFNVVDWNSFQIQAIDDIEAVTLDHIERDEWYRKYRDDDTNAETTSYDTPEFVFKTHGQGFGISPRPDKAYVLKYRYYKSFTPLSAYDDECDIPEEFNHVIIAGAMVWFNLFLDNAEAANLIKNEEYKPYLKSMRTLLINDDLEVRDTRVNF